MAFFFDEEAEAGASEGNSSFLLNEGLAWKLSLGGLDVRDITPADKGALGRCFLVRTSTHSEEPSWGKSPTKEALRAPPIVVARPGDAEAEADAALTISISKSRRDAYSGTLTQRISCTKLRFQI